LVTSKHTLGQKTIKQTIILLYRKTRIQQSYFNEIVVVKTVFVSFFGSEYINKVYIRDNLAGLHFLLKPKSKQNIVKWKLRDEKKQ
jgi:hypothetical protein